MFAANFTANDLSALAGSDVSGHVLWKDLTRTTLQHCLDAVLCSDLVVASRAIARAFVSTHGEGMPPQALPPLSTRQRAVLTHLAHGLTREQIAHEEHLSVRTVSRTITQLQDKLDAPTSFTLGMKLSRLGYWTDSSSTDI